MKEKLIVFIIIVVIVILCIIGAKNNNSKEDNNVVENKVENTIENVIEENIIEENIISQNNVVEEKIENKVEVQTQDVISTSTIYDTDPTIGTTDKKQEAIDLVKNKWGEDSTVEFRCDDITNEGIYVIAVVSKETAQVRNFFRVNLETKTVEVDY